MCSVLSRRCLDPIGMTRGTPRSHGGQASSEDILGLRPIRTHNVEAETGIPSCDEFRARRWVEVTATTWSTSLTVSNTPKQMMIDGATKRCQPRPRRIDMRSKFLRNLGLETKALILVRPASIFEVQRILGADAPSISSSTGGAAHTTQDPFSP